MPALVAKAKKRRKKKNQLARRLVKDAKAAGCPAFKGGGRVRRDELLAWLEKHPRGNRGDAFNFPEAGNQSAAAATVPVNRKAKRVAFFSVKTPCFEAVLLSAILNAGDAGDATEPTYKRGMTCFS